MKTGVLGLAGLIITICTQAQNVMTPELLWQLGRVSPVGITPDGQQLIYRVSTPNIAENTSEVKTYTVPLEGGTAREVTRIEGLLKETHASPDGSYRSVAAEVEVR